MSAQAIIDAIRANLIGQYTPIQTPFGSRPLVYADYTASGRSLRNIETAITEQVLPYYANTHSESSLCGAQSTALREQARQTIAKAIGCTARDRVIFCGAGATAAINRLIDMLGLRAANASWATPRDDAPRPVVFIGPYEHHSNELPWRESVADVVRIPVDVHGAIDEMALRDALAEYADRPLCIGSFSAASNVTGIISNVTGITALLKEFGALAFWDYAAGGPYLPINMNAPGAPIDAIFLSPHKFVGGPGTPGVLAIKAELASNPVPATIGGGTVSWVSPRRHHYLKDVERREEAGTPAVVEAIRAGLVFQLKQAVGADEIHRRESALLSRAREALVGCDQIEILGPADAQRFSILSLRIRCGSRELHYGFVVALLNDLFGIQARGGCSCAGPYGHELLAIDDEASQRYEASIAGGCAAMRPGWVRLNLNYFVSEAECDYIVGALKLVAEHGWRMLPAYQLDPGNGSWRYAGRERALPVELASLLSAEVGASRSLPEPDFDALLEEGRELLLKKATVTTSVKRVLMSEANEALRWFALPENPGDLRSAVS